MNRRLLDADLDELGVRLGELADDAGWKTRRVDMLLDPDRNPLAETQAVARRVAALGGECRG